MSTDEMLNIIRDCLIEEHLHLPVPLDSDRVYEMIMTSLKNARTKIDYELSKQDNK